VRAHRREILGLFPAFICSTFSISVAAQDAKDSTLPLPNKQTFQSGDFVWPKKPGAFVPYRNDVDASPDEEQQQWQAEKETFIKSIRSNPSYFSEADIAELENMTFREFYARYAGDQKPGVPGAYSTGSGIYVGHVGIIEVDSNKTPWVVEALMTRGVVRTSYDDWIASRPGEIVWHGRVRDLSPDDRAKIVAEAKRYLTKPYYFWNLDLNDDSQFYCSKLVWLAIWRSSGFAIDGDPNPKRKFWFSPKQLLYAKTIDRLHDPGPYANG
jgi:Permuted papain-like amidase enzyme, YaeF/YiiX, C92 family